MSWYTARNGEKQGPFDEETVRAKVNRGEIAPSDLVWRTGDASWKNAASIEGLLPKSSPPAATESALAPATPAASARETVSVAANYFVRHWRGDLPLPVSYWVNGIGSTLLVVVLVLLVGQIDWTEHASVAATASAAALLFSVVATLWQVVGVWRSAEKHPARGGRPGWATAAKAMVVLGVLQSAVQMSNNVIPQLAELTRIATGDARMAGHTLRVLRDASDLEITGPIAFGLTDDVQAVLDAHRTINTLHLMSPGGRTEEAKKLAALVEARGLNTHVASECQSACAFVFVAGRERTVNAGAKLGFHGVSFPGVDDFAKASATREMTEFMVARGVDRGFVERALAVDGDEMWYPTLAELEQARVLTRVAAEGEMALSGLSNEQRENFEQELLKTDLFLALRDHEPDVYAQALAALRDGYLRGRTLLEVRAELMPAITELYMKRLPYGDDSSMIAVTEIMLKQLRELRAKDPALCYKYANNELEGIEISESLRSEEITRMGQLIRSAALGNYGPRPGPQFDAQVEQVVMEMAEVWGDDIAFLAQIGQPNPQGSDDTLCALTIDLYERILTRPPGEAAQMLRTMFGAE